MSHRDPGIEILAGRGTAVLHSALQRLQKLTRAPLNSQGVKYASALADGAEAVSAVLADASEHPDAMETHVACLEALLKERPAAALRDLFQISEVAQAFRSWTLIWGVSVTLFGLGYLFGHLGR